MGKTDEFAGLDATAQAELVKTKQVKPIELVEAAIARIEKLNPKLNAVITPMFDEARTQAESDLPDGPFKGVPFLLKDLVAEYKGTRFAEGTDFSGEYISEHDTELVTRYKKAGVIVLGKTNAPEMGILPTTEPRRFGPSRNPWNLDHSTGGSSGGSGAAVGARIVPMAHGNDGGGSIRIPASNCGTFGMKPTRNRNTLAPGFGELVGGFVCEHVLTISVRDCAAMLDATAGPAIGEPYYATPPKRPFLDEVGADPGKLRIGFLKTAPTGVAVHEECVNAVLETVKLCEELGHDLEEASVKVNGAMATTAALTVMNSSFAWEVKCMAKKYGRKPGPEHFEPLTWAIKEMGEKFSAVDYITAITQLHRFSREINEQVQKYDVVLTPTMAEPPPPLGSFDSTPKNPLMPLIRASNAIPFTSLCNITGQPAMSVPLYWTKDNLPVGLHFIGKYADEATLYRLAAQLEKAKPWADKKPEISA